MSHCFCPKVWMFNFLFQKYDKLNMLNKHLGQVNSSWWKSPDAAHCFSMWSKSRTCVSNDQKMSVNLVDLPILPSIVSLRLVNRRRMAPNAHGISDHTLIHTLALSTAAFQNRGSESSQIIWKIGWVMGLMGTVISISFFPPETSIDYSIHCEQHCLLVWYLIIRFTLKSCQSHAVVILFKIKIPCLAVQSFFFVKGKLVGYAL